MGEEISNQIWNVIGMLLALSFVGVMVSASIRMLQCG